VKPACRIADFRAGQTWLCVGPVAPADAEEWASVTLRGFGMPEEGLADMMAASVEDLDFRPFAVWDGDEMVATARLFVRGEVGSLNSAATLLDIEIRARSRRCLRLALTRPPMRAAARWWRKQVSQKETRSIHR
jgi:hypothetical protein